MTDSNGFLSSDPAPAAASNVDMPDPDQSKHTGFLDSLESFGSAVVHTTEAAVESTYHAGKTVITDVGSGVEQFAQKTVNIGTGAISSVAMNLVLVLAVVGVSLYFVAKTGAVKAIISR